MRASIFFFKHAVLVPKIESYFVSPARTYNYCKRLQGLQEALTNVVIQMSSVRVGCRGVGVCVCVWGVCVCVLLKFPVNLFEVISRKVELDCDKTWWEVAGK